MKSITIHKMDDQLAAAIEEMAKKTGLSQNKVIQRLLRKALGVAKEEEKSDFSDLCGVLSEEEAEELIESLKVFDEIDEEMWK